MVIPGEKTSDLLMEPGPRRLLNSEPRRPLQLQDLTALSKFMCCFVQVTASRVTLTLTLVPVVEDNLINQRVLRKQLDMAGMKTKVANNGVEAVEQYKAGSFHLLIMDIEVLLPSLWTVSS